ncbi:hypothetical protein HW555_009421 [Spodoptera exigua]|uniref:Regulatory protein zeste n=1 Tax=Spodoptera exigua TaxID=7107 RepID=A0A835L3I4_SPOEX|nr:hypothetical protein HW555_009421 [Spodoptera exigua]
MQQSALIVENKLSDTNSNKKKNMEWIKIQSKLQELTGKKRDIVQIKGFWRRSKIAAKKSVSLHRRAINITGDGQKPPSPPPSDLKIMDLCPIEIVMDSNEFESDTAVQITCIDQQNVSFVEKVVTVADVHNYEINKTCDNVMVPPKEVREETKTKPQKKTVNQNSKSSIIEANLEGKKLSIALLEEEYKLKIEFQKRELAHQEQRQKIEIDLLMVEKEKKGIRNTTFEKKIT